MRTSTTSDPVVPASRRRLSAVLNEAGDVVRIDDVVNALEVSRAEAAKLLSRWVEQAWLRRAARGVYLPASLTTLDSIRVLDDPWILVPPLFDPAYIGGRTSAEHWDLTEQIFRDIVVMTAQTVRQKSQRRPRRRVQPHARPPGEDLRDHQRLAWQNPGSRWPTCTGPSWTCSPIRHSAAESSMWRTAFRSTSSRTSATTTS